MSYRFSKFYIMSYRSNLANNYSQHRWRCSNSVKYLNIEYFHSFHNFIPGTQSPQHECSIFYHTHFLSKSRNGKFIPNYFSQVLPSPSYYFLLSLISFIPTKHNINSSEMKFVRCR